MTAPVDLVAVRAMMEGVHDVMARDESDAKVQRVEHCWPEQCWIVRLGPFASEKKADAALKAIAAARELVPALAAEVVTLRRDRDMLRQNMRDTYEAMVSMRNSINEFIPMPSLESDLLQGPENSVFCATVAEAVVAYVQANRATIAGLEARVDALAGERDRQYDQNCDQTIRIAALEAHVEKLMLEKLSGGTPDAN